VSTQLYLDIPFYPFFIVESNQSAELLFNYADACACTGLAYASSCRMTDEKSSALVNIDLSIKALNDKIRTAASSVEKIEEETAKLTDQRKRQEASFIASQGPLYSISLAELSSYVFH